MTEVMTNTATLIRSRNGNGRGEVYRLDPPLDGHAHVWVSAVTVPFTGPETYIFGSDADGEVADWLELPGSYRGGLSITQALTNAGYEVSA